jgi:predicted RNA-binding Zn-ribbon protein involved in translation (DUF1610 family)
MEDDPAIESDGDAGKAPRCPVCGWTDVRRSRPKGFLDGLVRIVGLVPYRCRSCGQRFYRF